MQIEYLSHFGSDLMVVDAARVSFDKKSGWLDEQNKFLKSEDARLITYLAKHNHWTPFAHPQLQVRVTVPIFIANQLKRHQVGLAVNEVSRRYVDAPPEFYTPKGWRKRPDKSIKQGSSDEEVAMIIVELENGDYKPVCIEEAYSRFLRSTEYLYNLFINGDVCPEQVRMLLPQSMYTSWIWTGSLQAFIRVYQQRIDLHAQKEVQEIAKQLGEILLEHFPYSFEAWTNKE